jgi:hypothetical protein
MLLANGIFTEQNEGETAAGFATPIFEIDFYLLSRK